MCPRWRLESGSSPLARGTPLAPAVADGESAVHPRSRGEHFSIARRARPVQRFIPARAGNTAAASGPDAVAFGSSPLARGTHLLSASEAEDVVGSSPLARGTRSRCPSLDTDRFIPARAGNTAVGALQRRRRRFIPARAGNTYAGAKTRVASDRFIPARAGNTCGASRRRGQHGTIGSSPLARGTRPATRQRPAQDGSSPLARGTRGQRSCSTRPGFCQPVHPRSRGEHYGLTGDRGNTATGSSPLARGTHRVR